MEDRPQIPGERQASVFDEDEGLQDYDRAEYRRGIRRARNTLFFAGVLMFLTDMIMLGLQRELYAERTIYFVAGIDVAILAVFIGLGLWTARKPYAAIVSGLVLFIVLQIVAMINDPSNIYKGWLFKIIIVGSLITGLKKARALTQMDAYAAGKFN